MSGSSVHNRTPVCSGTVGKKKSLGTLRMKAHETVIALIVQPEQTHMTSVFCRFVQSSQSGGITV